MTELYGQQSYPQRPSSQYLNNSSVVYPNPLASAAIQSHPSAGHTQSTPGDDDPDSPPKSTEASPTENKPPQKTQSTFLTKLYSLLEKPENHHMIRWDPAGDHIIVERPEQLALHVLPSVYRQSRFASFSRQLNIYGFMRKVNLRNVDPAIDDPDASTWSHPTLNRHSPPEVVANFKRRVPPRLPKPRKRQETEIPQIPPTRSALGMGPVPLTVPSSLDSPGNKGRARGFSAPGSFTPVGSNSQWGQQSYSRSALPPLTVPTDSPMNHSMYGSHSAHPGLHPLSPTEDTPQSASTGFSPASYGSTSIVNSQYGYSTAETASPWTFSPNTATSQSHNSLSQLLNPSSNYHQRSSLSTNYPPSFSSVPLQNNHSTSSLSPDSRPTTGYSVSSMSSLPYDTESTTASTISHDYSRPGSSHRGLSPTRSHSTHKPGIVTSGIGMNSAYSSSTSNLNMGVGAGSVNRRPRRHSQLPSPYPSPYDTHGTSAHHLDSTSAHGMHHAHHDRPSTSPHPPTPGVADHHSASQPRVRSMILPPVESYSYGGGHNDFTYSSGGASNGGQTSPPMHTSVSGQGTGHLSNVDMEWGRSVRPSTSASSLSAASHTSSSQANTPPNVDNGYGAGEDINRFVFNQSRPTSASSP